MISTSKPIKDVALAYGVGPETLRNWLIKYREANGGTETELTVSERVRLKELERENQELKAETAFLKKDVYTSSDFRTLVTSLGMRSSMGRTGVCWDNSMAESFFSMLKNERVYRTVYATKTQARSDIIRYIEGFYNSRRRHSGLGYRRPNEVHYAYQQPVTAA
ncbi:transposase InsO family protein [Glaciihabitans sp. UYNi722]